MMTRSLTHLLLLSCIAFAGLTLSACESGSDEGPSLDSNTNWLQACDSSAACATDFICACGVCAPACGSDQCVPGEATCALDGVVVHERLCAEDSQAQICVPNCTEDAECGTPNECIEGLCTPRLSTLDAGSADAGSGDAGQNDGGADSLPVDAAADARTCPGEASLYCGPTFGLEPNVLYRCAAGDVTIEVECAEDCLARPMGDHQCGERCPPGEEFVCAAALGVDGGELYRCTTRGARFERPCPAGCEERAGNDDCIAE